ncbi:MAG TPA: hypothetical protein ENO08_01520 [Candidatus Eisenbacteria bacterium]|uniref:DNRLRE domain-containing protein n=1 Tax=Eiseniibacteriota bacterium TaxID=2212470 RepID=A0A7V2ATT5_UNCEI|nr:hypothetical protein [Candidatus Eisenbacteria bacterium]
MIAPLFATILLAAGCSGDSDAIFFGPAPGEKRTIEFQDGRLPTSSYFGTRDAFLKDGPGLDAVNFGITPSDTVGSRLLTEYYYESRYIVRMDVSLLTDCSEITRAEMRLHLGAPSADSLVFEAYEAAVPQVIPGTWVEGLGGAMNGVDWKTVDGSVPWDTPGGDLSGAPFDSATVTLDSTMVFDIPAELALRWVEEPLSNHGIVVRLVGTMPGEHAVLRARESAAALERPRLLIEYIPGG